jgi:hypothetical protein
MVRRFAIAAGLAMTVVGMAAPAMADAYCGPGFFYSRHWGECRPNGGYRYGYYETTPGYVAGSAVNGAGYVAGSAVNAAGNVAGAAVGTAGAIVGGVLGR